MRRRVAIKILRRWSSDFGYRALPYEAFVAGKLPWKWSTWCRAHVTIARARYVGRGVVP
jgi:hypothetical protein